MPAKFRTMLIKLDAFINHWLTALFCAVVCAWMAYQVQKFWYQIGLIGCVGFYVFNAFLAFKKAGPRFPSNAK
jgi:hypothetical protein